MRKVEKDLIFIELGWRMIKPRRRFLSKKSIANFFGDDKMRIKTVKGTCCADCNIVDGYCYDNYQSIIDELVKELKFKLDDEVSINNSYPKVMAIIDEVFLGDTE